MPIVTFTIDVTEKGKATVTRSPEHPKFKSGRDQVIFKATGDPRQTALAAVKFPGASPFARFGAGGQPESISQPKGPFVCEKIGLHHFDCGVVSGGVFTSWTGTLGDDIDVPC